MRIALDFDGTVTIDPYAWAQVVEVLLRCRHEVVLVTNRGPGWGDNRFPESEPREIAEAWGIPLILCGPRPKRECVSGVDVWIDDHPEWVDGGPWLVGRTDMMGVS